MFGLERSIDIDVRELERRFKELQRGLHPDKFAYRQQQQQQQQQQRGDPGLDELELSATASALVNKAYQTLRTPLERVKYVLEEEGVMVLSESSGGAGGGRANEQSAATTNPALLMEVMELREAIEDFRAAKDSAGLQSLGDLASARVDECMAAITAQHATRRGASDADEAVLSAMASEAVRLQYFSKIYGEVDEALEACKS